ncbi:MAG: NAD-dependent epimerase/dehydratase family protein [Clostridia bacterium]|nr:NAD-dependent epimerase/dehydratase family protein [Clostridia bacterium]
MNEQIITEDLQSIAARIANKDKLNGCSVLISGVSGFIASWIVRLLLELNDREHRNIQVYGLYRSEKHLQERFGQLLQRDDVHMLRADVSQPLMLEDRMDYIIHAASQTSPESFRKDPVGTALGNVTGCANLLKYAADCKAKGFLLLSTREIYGKAVADFVTEDDYGPLDPTAVRSCYPEGKRMAETLCAAYREQYGLDCRIARIAHCFGPGMVLSDGRVVGDFIGNTVRGEDIVMNSDGSGTLALTYVADVAAGLMQTMLDFPDFVYNVSNDASTVTVRQLAETLCGLYPAQGAKVVIHLADAAQKSGYLQHKVGFLQSGKAKQAGWSASFDLESGLKRTVDYYKG